MNFQAQRERIGIFRRLVRDDYLISAVTVMTVGLFVFVSLKLTDIAIRAFDEGYVATDSPVRAVTIFALVAYPFSIYMRSRGWSRLEPTIIASLSLFIPIIFFNVAVQYLIRNEIVINHIGEDLTSGPAFAGLVYLQILRAMPTVILAPFVFWHVFNRLSDWAERFSSTEKASPDHGGV